MTGPVGFPIVLVCGDAWSHADPTPLGPLFFSQLCPEGGTSQAQIKHAYLATLYEPKISLCKTFI